MSSPYSKTSLAKKLGIKSGLKIRLINQPAYYFNLFPDMPDNVEIITNQSIKKDFIHWFVTQAKDIKDDISLIKNGIKHNVII